MRRSVAAAVLLAIAVVLPLAAWWISGSRRVSQEAAERAASARNEREDSIAVVAAHLAESLYIVRAEENARPFYHYQNLYHDPRGVTRGLSVIPSPLSEGPTHQLIELYFQIDSKGEISLPTVNEEFPELSAEQGYATYCAFLEEMESSLVVNEEGHFASGERVVELSAAAWQQIEEANEVYGRLTGSRVSENGPPAPATSQGDRVAVTVSGFRWHTIFTVSGPMLAALRQVETPAGVLVQGFTISGHEIQRRLADDAIAFTVDRPVSGEGVSSSVANTGWFLVADSDHSTEIADQALDELHAVFARQFMFGAGAALLAALSIFVIVVQSNALARKRAQFAAAAAHELKTPLAALELYSEMLEDSLGKPEKRAAYAARVSAEAARLGRVVTNILELSRLERGAELVHPEVSDLAEVVRSTVEGLRQGLEAARLEVRLHIDNDPCHAWCDADAIRQIIVNLLDNAEKHTRGTSARRVDLRLRAGSRFACLEVRDNGPGIDPAERRHLFKAFRRNALKNTAGLGLGLALGRILARAQGGDLGMCDDSPGTGACFILKIPTTADHIAGGGIQR